ncbi:hypothetical protein ACWDRX_32360, partial [Streptomyces nigra]
MHAYDVPRRQGGSSPTPIYDALYAEYVKSFRSLPGDRSGEEDLGFVAFGNIQRGTGTYGGHRPGSFSSSYSAYSAGAHSARRFQAFGWHTIEVTVLDDGSGQDDGTAGGVRAT